MALAREPWDDKRPPKSVSQVAEEMILPQTAVGTERPQQPVEFHLINGSAAAANSNHKMTMKAGPPLHPEEHQQ
jgi:hypothetical protein